MRKMVEIVLEAIIAWKKKKKWTKECKNSWKQLLNYWIFNYAFLKKQPSVLVDK